MTKIKQIDTYITDTISLVTSSPSSTSVTLTYTHSNKHNIIKFKTYNPKLGICYNFKTYKIKEFSKLFNALGPRNCIVGGSDIKGLGLIMCNADKEDIIVEKEILKDDLDTNSAGNKNDGSDKNTEEISNKKSKKGKKKGKKH